MKKDARHHPIIEERFNDLMLTIIEIKLYWEGLPPKVSHYTAFCGTLYVLRHC